MAFTTCNHLLSTTPKCSDNPPPGSAKVCVCANAAKTQVWARVFNIHTSTHGKLVAITPPPSGFTAAYELQHDTTSAQGSGAVDGAPVAWNGTDTVKIRIKYKSGSSIVNYDVQTSQPENC